MFERGQRLKKYATESEEDLSQPEKKQLNLLKKHGYVVGKHLLQETPVWFMLKFPIKQPEIQ